jgi:energy-coupling factor transporter ATP-binding protein EcfA2
MITRLYVNNYRSLVAFEIRFDSMNVFCGANGSGKSSMFDAIQFVCALATGACFLGGLSDTRGRTVSHFEFTNWIQSNTQEIECHEPRIIQEAAFCDDKELYTRDAKGVNFDNDRSGFPLDWRQAALLSIRYVSEAKLNYFKRLFQVSLSYAPMFIALKWRAKPKVVSLTSI